MSVVQQYTTVAPGDGLRVVGHDVQRFDALEKVTGRGQYVADVVLPGLVEGKVLRSPHPHARIVRVDTGRAVRLPGVVAVVTAEDTPKHKLGNFRQDTPVLAFEKVRYVGEEVAAVAAVDEDTAAEALIEVEYEELPAAFDPVEAMQPGAPLVHEDQPNNVLYHFTIQRGDPDAALARAGLVLEETFETKHQWHCSLERTGCVAAIDSRGRLTVWANSNGVFHPRHEIAHVLGLKEHDVRVIQTLVGGAFGGRGHDNNHLVCAILAMKARRPVRIINSREEDFMATRPGVPCKLWLRVGFLADGTVSGKEIKAISDNGAYSSLGPRVATVATMRHDQMLLNRDLRAELYSVYTNKVPTSAFRGFGNPGQWAMQQMLDIGARELGLDPKEVLLKNAIGPNFTTVHGCEIKSCELKACIQRAAELIGWDEKRANPKPNRGLGIAASGMVSGRRTASYDGSTAAINLGLDGSVQVFSGEGETGQGARIVLAQIAAEEIGVRYEDVLVSETDTETTHYALGTHASRNTYVAGNAVRDAARQVKEQLLDVAANVLETSAADLEIKDGIISVKGAAEKSVSVSDVARKSLFRPGGRLIAAIGSWDAPDTMPDTQIYCKETGAYNFCAQAVELEVDPETGKVTILNMTMAADAGTVINPIGAEGQNEGGLAQGIGYGITEGLVFESGRLVNPNFSDHRLLCVADMPPFKQEFVPSYEPTGPFGAKGIGQIGLDPAAPAIANAVYDAVGVRVTDLPMSADKIFYNPNNKRRANNGREQ